MSGLYVIKPNVYEISNLQYITCKIWAFFTKNKLEFQQHAYQEQLTLDKQSRVLEDAIEWILNPNFFNKIVEKFGKSELISI